MKDKLHKLLNSKNIIIGFLVVNVIAYIGYAVEIGDYNEPVGKSILAAGHLLCFTAVLLFWLKNKDIFK